MLRRLWGICLGLLRARKSQVEFGRCVHSLAPGGRSSSMLLKLFFSLPALPERPAVADVPKRGSFFPTAILGTQGWLVGFLWEGIPDPLVLARRRPDGLGGQANRR